MFHAPLTGLAITPVTSSVPGVLPAASPNMLIATMPPGIQWTVCGRV